LSQNPRYRVLTDLNQIYWILNSTYETVLFSNGDLNVMAVVTNLGMIGEDLTDLGYPQIATYVNTAAKILFSYPMFRNNNIIDRNTIANVGIEILKATTAIKTIHTIQ
jgi:hypothetical protein